VFFSPAKRQRNNFGPHLQENPTFPLDIDVVHRLVLSLHVASHHERHQSIIV
jgi:hypothetical protein